MAEEGQVIACHSEAVWKENLAKGKETGKLIVVDFTAAWCGPCRAIAPYFTELAKTHPSVMFLKVDVDELQGVAKEFAIEAMPTFILMKNEEVLDKIVGTRKPELLAKIEQHASSAAPAVNATAST